MIGVRALKQTRLGVARIVGGKTFSRLPREVDTRRTRLAGGAATLLSSHAGDPRPATSDAAKGSEATPADSLKESQLAARSRPSPGVGRRRPDESKQQASQE